jgi:hypothetical protein
VFNSGADSVRIRPDPSTRSLIGFLPPNVFADVAEQTRGSDGRIWFKINALIEGGSITGWVRSDTVSQPFANCPPLD